MENLCQIELNEGWNWLDWRVGSSHYTWYSRHDKTRSWPLEEDGWRVEGAWRSCGECNDPPISSSLLSSVRSAMQCNVNAVQLWSAHILPSPARSVSSLNFSLVGQCSILLVEDGLLLWTCGIGSPESWSSADPWRPFLAVGSHLFKARDGGQPVSGLLLKIPNIGSTLLWSPFIWVEDCGESAGWKEADRRASFTWWYRSDTKYSQCTI